MVRAEDKPKSSGTQLEKSPTGIKGLDEVTKGGLPKGRPTLVCGGAGSGKTLLAAEFLVRGALQFGEPGVFMSFEETSEELTKNVVSLGFKLDDLVAQKKISLDYVQIDRSEIEETGEYDLEGLYTPWTCDRFGRCKASGAGYHRNALFRNTQSCGCTGRAEAPVSMVKRQRHDNHHHRRAGRKNIHASRLGGIRFRLRHFS